MTEGFSQSSPGATLADAQRDTRFGFLARVLNAAAAPMIALDTDFSIIAANRPFRRLFGLSADPAGADAASVLGAVALPSGLGDEVSTVRGAIGEAVSINWSPTSDGVWMGAASATDLSWGACWRAGSDQEARRDPLTRLMNRSSLISAFDDLRHQCFPEEIAALCLDLDRFKEVNDTLGHVVGDTVLSRVAGRLRAVASATDAVARFGGDEFVLLIARRDVAREAESLARTIVELMSRPFLINGAIVAVGASIGVARLDKDPAADPVIALNELLRRADVGLYASKCAGRGRSTWFDPVMDAERLERRAMEDALRSALPMKQFFLEFQPQVETGSGALQGFEALIRWRHPELGRMAPLEFLPIAEDLGLMEAIGTWVLEEACAVAAQWRAPLGIAVNVSPKQFVSEDFVATVEHALSRAQLAAPRLEIEITETALLGDEEAARRSMDALHALGVKLSIDDFGTGYSSLSYLQRYPFDKIKIDQSFIRVEENDSSAQKIVAAVTALGRAFGMEIIAEGVETPSQVAQVAADGCDTAQGYFFGRPMTLEAANALAQGPQAAQGADGAGAC